MQLYIDNRLILEWDEENTRIIQNHLLPFELRDRLIDTHDNHGVYKQRNQKENMELIQDFLSNRLLDLDRDNAIQILQAHHYPSELSEQQRANIVLDCHSVSITDNYWTKEKQETCTWNDINIRHNSLNKIIQQIALTGNNLTLEGKPHTPEYTNQGCFAKAWIREKDGLYLCKAAKTKGSYNEIKQEILASNILDCTNIEHVQYDHFQYDSIPTCRCKNIASDRYSVVSADHVNTWCKQNQIDLEDFVLQLDPNHYYQMQVADYIINNPDRHLKNWGFFQDNITGELIGLHPLFDHNFAFQKQDDNREIVSKLNQHCTLRDMAEDAVKHCHFAWQKPVSPELFPDKSMYDNFVKRCSNIGLYKQKTIWRIPVPYYQQVNSLVTIQTEHKSYSAIVHAIKKQQMQAVKELMDPEADFDQYLKQMNIRASTLSAHENNIHEIEDIER